MADEAIKHGKVEIQDALDFYRWPKESQGESKVHYVFVSKDDITKNAEHLSDLCKDIISVKGTMKAHSAQPAGDYKVLIRDTSFFCHNCHPGKASDKETAEMCSGWTLYSLKKRKKVQDLVDEKRYREHEVIDNDVEQSLQVDINDFVLAVYAFNRKAYIGKVINIDTADSEVFVSFMKASTADGSADGINEPTTLNWPYHPDKIWVEKGDIFMVLPEPQQAASSSRRRECIPSRLFDCSCHNACT